MWKHFKFNTDNKLISFHASLFSTYYTFNLFLTNNTLISLSLHENCRIIYDGDGFLSNQPNSVFKEVLKCKLVLCFPNTNHALATFF